MEVESSLGKEEPDYAFRYMTFIVGL